MSSKSQRDRAERAAAAVKERQAKERRRQVLTVAGVVVAMVLIIGGGFFINSLRDGSGDTAASAPTAGSDLGLTVGPDSAPHQVVIYEDFLCPFCGELEKQTHEQLQSLADAGKVQVEYRPFAFLTNLGDYSQQATEAFAVALEQSGPEVALALHNALFADQPSEEGPFPSTDDLAATMTEAGADAATVQAFQDGAGERWVSEATDAATSIGVGSTPTIVLDGKPFQGGRTIDDLAENLLAALQ